MSKCQCDISTTACKSVYDLLLYVKVDLCDLHLYVKAYTGTTYRYMPKCMCDQSISVLQLQVKVSILSIKSCIKKAVWFITVFQKCQHHLFLSVKVDLPKGLLLGISVCTFWHCVGQSICRFYCCPSESTFCSCMSKHLHDLLYVKYPYALLLSKSFYVLLLSIKVFLQSTVVCQIISAIHPRMPNLLHILLLSMHLYVLLLCVKVSVQSTTVRQYVCMMYWCMLKSQCDLLLCLVYVSSTAVR